MEISNGHLRPYESASVRQRDIVLDILESRFVLFHLEDQMLCVYVVEAV